MERKYYLRGLGIGIAVTAIIMGIALSGNETMTDEEIIARAKELGMVENTVLSDIKEEDSLEVEDGADQQDVVDEPEDMTEAGPDIPEQENEPADAGDAESEIDSLEESETGSDQTDLASAEAQEQPEEDGQEEGGTTEPAENSSKPGEIVEAVTSATLKTITVSSGDGSYTVARKLADVGAVPSAEAFDTFLCQHGYDKKLRTGTYSIPADATDEQIARIVTGAE